MASLLNNPPPANEQPDLQKIQTAISILTQQLSALTSDPSKKEELLTNP